MILTVTVTLRKSANCWLMSRSFASRSCFFRCLALLSSWLTSTRRLSILCLQLHACYHETCCHWINTLYSLENTVFHGRRVSRPQVSRLDFHVLLMFVSTIFWFYYIISCWYRADIVASSWNAGHCKGKRIIVGYIIWYGMDLRISTCRSTEF